MGELGVTEGKDMLQHVFQQYDLEHKAELTPIQIQMLYGDLRMGSISLPQVYDEFLCIKMLYQ